MAEPGGIHQEPPKTPSGQEVKRELHGMQVGKTTPAENSEPPADPNFHDAPTIERLTEKLLQEANLRVLESFGITRESIKQAAQIASEYAKTPVDTHNLPEKVDWLTEKTKSFINNPDNFPGQKKVHFITMKQSDGLGYVGVNLFGQHNEYNGNPNQSTEELISNSMNQELLKLHIQVPDDLVPFVGLLTGQALKSRALRDYEHKNTADVCTSWKMFGGIHNKGRAGTSRIVIYTDGKFTDPKGVAIKEFQEAVSILSPILKIMNVGGLKETATTDDDVEPPIFNTPVKLTENGAKRIVPNLFLAFGTGNLRQELASRELVNSQNPIDISFDAEYNHAIPKGINLGPIIKYI